MLILGLWEYYQYAFFLPLGVSIPGVLPETKNKIIGSIITTHILCQEYSRKPKIKVLGVLPEPKNKSTGSTPRVSSGSIITDLYIKSGTLPVYDFKGSGSTPTAFSDHFCGSTPASLV